MPAIAVQSLILIAGVVCKIEMKYSYKIHSYKRKIIIRANDVQTIRPDQTYSQVFVNINILLDYEVEANRVCTTLFLYALILRIFFYIF